MELAFIWVKEFQTLKNFSLNLSNTHKYNYDEKTRQLTREDNNELPSNFYGSDVSSLIGLFGRNGAGKTSCLKLIGSVMSGAKSRIKSDFIVVTRRKSDLITCYYHYKNNPDVTPEPVFDGKCNKVKYSSSVTGLNTVFLSNTYDNSDLFFDKKIHDLSLKNRIGRKKEFLENLSFMGSKAFINSSFYKNCDINVSIPKLTAPKFSKIENMLVQHSLIKGEIEGDYKIEETRILLKGVILKYNELFLSLPKSLANQTVKTMFIYSNILAEISILIGLYRPIYSDVYEYVSCLNNAIDIDCVKNGNLKIILNNIVNGFLKYAVKVQFKMSDAIRSRIKRIESFLSLDIEEYNIYLNSSHKGDNSYIIKTKYSKKDINFIRQLPSSRVDLSFANVSSGEQAMLSLLSSLYQQLRTRRNATLILLDEADLYLHPEWQLDFVSTMLKVLSSLNKSSVQVILTSHSPLIMTDFSRSNALMLETKDGRTSIVEIDINPLGANLYDLYSHGFFLKERKVGSVAYEKIFGMLRDIESTSPYNDLGKPFWQTLELLGDDLAKVAIRRKLKEQGFEYD
ncbi:TPA: ATP-binding protein [Vibrio harveyi]|nr:ATP-binding protein [Vibrio harveyi]